jgi:hypothetical protein
VEMMTAFAITDASAQPRSDRVVGCHTGCHTGRTSACHTRRISLESTRPC